jgi:adenylate cyclase
VVNTASRLEALTKEYGSQLVVSEEVALAADMDLSAYRSEEVQVRGRTQPLHIRVVASALDLAAALDQSASHHPRKAVHAPYLPRVGSP